MNLSGLAHLLKEMTWKHYLQIAGLILISQVAQGAADAVRSLGGSEHSDEAVHYGGAATTTGIGGILGFILGRKDNQIANGGGGENGENI